MSRRLSRVLCLAVLPLAWAGTEAVVPPAGGRLLVTAERGMLTVVAEAIELQQVLQAITSQSGSPIMLVNAPDEPLPVTVTIKQQPLAHVIPRLLEALRTSGSLSYVIVHPPQQPPWVKIFFPMMANASEHRGETTQEHRRSGRQPKTEPEPSPTPPPAGVGASILTAEELDGLREELGTHGVVTEGLDDEQLLDLTQRLDQGLPVYEGEPEPSPKPPQVEVVASVLTAEELDWLRETLLAHGAATEGLDDEQLLELCRTVVCLDTVR